MSILFTAMFSGIEIIWDKQFGFLKETLAAPVSRFNIMLGRTLGGATVATLQGIIVFFISLLVGFRPNNWYMIFFSLVFMFLIAIVFTAVGTAIASKLEDMHGFQLIMNFLIMPTFFLSGAIFPLTDLPPLINKIIIINPLSYGVDGLRLTLAGVSLFGFWLDLLVLLGLAVITLIIGSYFFSEIEI